MPHYIGPLQCNTGAECYVYMFVVYSIEGNGDKPINVTSKDLISHNPNYAPAHAASQEEDQAQQHKGIRIVSLAPGQSLSVECDAILVVSLRFAHS